MLELYAIITGTVQGVYFRNYTQQAANECGLVGYVKNNSDGSVTAVAQGSPDALRSFVEYLHEGSSLSEVAGVSLQWRHPGKDYDDFSIR